MRPILRTETYSVIQSNKQYNEFVVSHSDVLEQLVLTAHENGSIFASLMG
jgi:hypothetical protein